MSRPAPRDVALRAVNPVPEGAVSGAAHDATARAAFARIVATRRPLAQRRGVRRTAAAVVGAAALSGLVVAAMTLPPGEGMTPAGDVPVAPAPATGDPGEAVPFAEVPEPVRALVTGDESVLIAVPGEAPPAPFVPASLRRAVATGGFALWTVRTEAAELFWIAAEPRSVLGFGAVDAVPNAPFRTALYRGDGPRPDLALLTGALAPDVASLEFIQSDGERRPAAVGNGYYLLPFRPLDAVPVDHVARDAGGAVIATGLAPLPPHPAPVEPPPDDPGEALPLAEAPAIVRDQVASGLPAAVPTPDGRGATDLPIQAAALRRALVAQTDLGRYEIWTTRTAAGELVVMLVAPPGEAGATGAGLAPAPPPPYVDVIGSGVSGADSPATFHGRVSPEVTEIAAVYSDGSRISGSVANGYFVLLLPRDRGVPESIAGLDAAGEVVASGGTRDLRNTLAPEFRPPPVAAPAGRPPAG